MAPTVPGRPVPPLDDLITLIQASLRNSASLLDDARLLLGSGRAPRAHALATLALEEIGKAFLCMLALLPMPIAFYGVKSGDDFWAAWREHTDKLAWALGFREFLLLEPPGPAEQAFNRLRAAVSDGHLRKLRGFYVDYDGQVLEPGEISPAEAEQIIADTRLLLDIADRTWLDDGLRDRITEALAGHAEELAEMLASVGRAVTEDTDGTLTRYRAVIQDQLGPLNAAADPPDAAS